MFFDYWLFGVIEGKSNVTSHPSVNSLKASFRRALRNFDPEDVKRSCSRFCSRISRIIDANVSHIEWFCSVDNNKQINTNKNCVLSLFAFQNSELKTNSVSPNLAARPCIYFLKTLKSFEIWFALSTAAVVDDIAQCHCFKWKHVQYIIKNFLRI